MALPPAERSKLAKVLGMLGSDHAGERQSAGLAANRIVKDAGLSWEQVLQAQNTGAGRAVPPQADTPHEVGYRSNLEHCRRHLALLSIWERSFVCSLVQRRKPASPNQINKLAEIADALRKDGNR